MTPLQQELARMILHNEWRKKIKAGEVGDYVQVDNDFFENVAIPAMCRMLNELIDRTADDSSSMVARFHDAACELSSIYYRGEEPNYG